MSTINAASSGQVRYVATLALRAGKVPTLVGVTQPVLSKQQANQAKAHFTKLIIGAVKTSNGQLAPAAHQLAVLQQMCAISGVSFKQPTNRWVADQWLITWFKNATPAQVVQLVSAMQHHGGAVMAQPAV